MSSTNAAALKAFAISALSPRSSDQSFHTGTTGYQVDDAPNRLVVSIDFGTTQSTVSFAGIRASDSGSNVNSASIRSIDNYPHCVDSSSDARFQVPTALLYCLKKSKVDELLAQTNNNNVNDDRDDSDDSDRAYEDGPIITLPKKRGRKRKPDPWDPSIMKWGYSVYKELSFAHTDPNHKNDRDKMYVPLHHFKLLLDDNPNTLHLRQGLEKKISLLMWHRKITKKWDIITHYLIRLLTHAKAELVRQGLDDEFSKEIVLCVPAVWKSSATRIMQTCLATALKESNFGGFTVNSAAEVKQGRFYIDNLFLVSEPEAAAAKVLQEGHHNLQVGETFLILDAGGGTVDISTYEISQSTPLRLKREQEPPFGVLHGASLVNQNFRLFMKTLLQDEDYLFQGDPPIYVSKDSLIDQLDHDMFESRHKRQFSNQEPDSSWTSMHVPGLQDNKEKNFSQQHMILSRATMYSLFCKHMEGIWKALGAQLERAATADHPVKTIVAVGGFSNSRCLQNYLRKRINKYNKKNPTRAVRIYLPEDINSGVNTVSAGAILRSLNRTAGPERILQSSYGVLRDEGYRDWPEHATQRYKPELDEVDGLYWVKNTILWVLSKGTMMLQIHTSQEIRCCHTFDTETSQLLKCQEKLYSTDSNNPVSHRKLRDTNNAQLVGDIVTDFTELRDTGELEIIIPTSGHGLPHYKIEYDLKLIVIGCHLQCQAIYKGRVWQKCQLNIAGAFLPGVN